MGAIDAREWALEYTSDGRVKPVQRPVERPAPPTRPVARLGLVVEPTAEQRTDQPATKAAVTTDIVGCRNGLGRACLIDFSRGS